MKKAIVCIFLLAAAASLVSCGTSPAAEAVSAEPLSVTRAAVEEALSLEAVDAAETAFGTSETAESMSETARAAAQTTATAQAGTSFVAPARPSATVPANAAAPTTKAAGPTAATKAPVAAPTTKSSTAATKAVTTAAAKPSTTKPGYTYGTTAAITTTRTQAGNPSQATTRATTSSAPTTTKSTTAATLPQIPAFSITVKGGGKTQTFTSADAAKLSVLTKTMTTVNSYGTVTNYSFTGVRVRDILSACGISVPSGAVLLVTSADTYTAELSYDLITAEDTLLAWKDRGDTLVPPRMAPRGSRNSALYVKEVASIELK
ncbi:MAG: molybdopterin-dependent oxidoreductase [Oscillospiraceae bacterium]|nr:molybdopterin-dependent oxidoreductase [Oscillospiraceae bacterium]